MSKVGVRINIPYLQGAYLGLNAIPDAFFLGDGPSCIFDKAAHIHGRHDLFSTLLSCDSEHRIQHTGVNVFNIAGDCEGDIASGLKRIAAFRGCGAIFLGSMPMCAIVGTDYERILRDSLAGVDMPSFVMPRRGAVSGDWLDGYAAIMEALASGMDLGGAAPEPGTAALVGYMMDRNEGDHHGNLRELERIFAALDLKLTTIWLSGRPYEDLRDVRRASKIVSLPYGRKAGKILSKRLGVPVAEAGLPFGLEATRRFVELLGREFGREAQADAFIARELDAVVPRLEWTVPHAFLNRRFAFAGDPHLAACFVEQIEALGGRMAGMIVVGGDYHLDPERKGMLESRPGTVFEPLPGDVSEQWGAIAEGGADLVVGSAFAFVSLRRGRRWMEFGYPSEETHFLREDPFLGFQGALGFLSRTANEVSRGLNEEREESEAVDDL